MTPDLAHVCGRSVEHIVPGVQPCARTPALCGAVPPRGTGGWVRRDPKTRNPVCPGCQQRNGGG